MLEFALIGRSHSGVDGVLSGLLKHSCFTAEKMDGKIRVTVANVTDIEKLISSGVRTLYIYVDPGTLLLNGLHKGNVTSAYCVDLCRTFLHEDTLFKEALEKYPEIVIVSGSCYSETVSMVLQKIKEIQTREEIHEA